jgi:hypothetical protein
MENPTRWLASEYLNLLQVETTRRSYASALKGFFSFIYDTDIPSKNNTKIVDELSSRYLSEDREYDKDAAAYFRSMSNYAPNTRALKFSVFKSWLEVNP